MIELLDDAARDPDGIEREHPQHHHRHVADRRVGDEPLPVLLRQRDERAVDDADDRQQHHHRHELVRRLGQDRQAEAQEPVRPHLQEHGRQNHRACGRRVGVRVGQPGVEREHRHLDGEAEKEREKHPPLQVRRERVLLIARDVEAVGPEVGRIVVIGEVQREDAEQHDDAADEGVQEELDRRVEPVRAAPDPDQEVHRHEHHFPEQEEEQEIERHERAEHAGLQHEQEDVVLLHPLGDRIPRRQHRDASHHRRQQDQEGAQAVDAEKILGPDRRDPGCALDELEVGALRREPEPQRHRDEEADEGDDVRDPPDGALVLLVDQQQEERAGQRREQDDREVMAHKQHWNAKRAKNEFPLRPSRALRSRFIAQTDKYRRTRRCRTASAARNSARDRSGTAGTRGSPPGRSSRPDSPSRRRRRDRSGPTTTS